MPAECVGALQTMKQEWSAIEASDVRSFSEIVSSQLGVAVTDDNSTNDKLAPKVSTSV